MSEPKLFKMTLPQLEAMAKQTGTTLTFEDGVATFVRTSSKPWYTYPLGAVLLVGFVLVCAWLGGATCGVAQRGYAETAVPRG